jgi:hypothetical protein
LLTICTPPLSRQVNAVKGSVSVRRAANKDAVDGLLHRHRWLKVLAGVGEHTQVRHATFSQVAQARRKQQ